ncbi:ATP-binding cassette domain-containing protein [soil metagenome]
MTASVRVEHLGKQFKVPVRESGLRASIRSLGRREHRLVDAVHDVTFDVAPGEIVGFLGPNGAGKTTTLKMLSGLLNPTAGSARVLGFEPFRRDADFLRRITLVMGNRNQLQWDLPGIDSFELHRAIYGLPRPQFVRRRDDLIERLELGALVNKPVRNLSLGERMKMEIADALLHEPEVLFLDEPTIGLDVTMQRRIREFLADSNRESGSTVLLTSHYMADVEALCRRVIVIHHGRLLFDGPLSALAARFATHKTVSVRLADDGADVVAAAGRLRAVVADVDITSATDDRLVVRVPRHELTRVAARILAELDVTDLSIEDPPIDDVIAQVFAGPASDGADDDGSTVTTTPASA